MPTGMPTALILIGFGVYVLLKYSMLWSGILIVVGAALFVVLLRRKPAPPK